MAFPDTNPIWQIIVNPNALTKARKILEEQFLQQLKALHISYVIHEANGTGVGTSIAQQLCQQGCHYLMIIGGDGSINEVVNGIYASGIDPTTLFLAIVPLGTGNDFCRTLAYPKREQIHIIPQSLQANNFKPVDIGKVEILHEEQITNKRYFINIAGFAFDAHVIKATCGRKPKFLPNAVYLTKLLKVLFHFKPIKVTVHTPQNTFTTSTFTIAIANAQFNGNGMRQAPMADPTDGQLDVVLIRKLSPFKVLANVKKLYAGKHIHLKEVAISRTNFVELSSPQTLYGEVEGEMLPTGNYRISVESKKLNVLSFLP